MAKAESHDEEARLYREAIAHLRTEVVSDVDLIFRLYVTLRNQQAVANELRERGVRQSPTRQHDKTSVGEVLKSDAATVGSLGLWFVANQIKAGNLERMWPVISRQQ
ncbi:hypothetical protein [Chitinimonas sp.]|uniref:hypothetical protein n=1 Tax=Chitinimonas sp. TaxID=1934313 RepID=UPI0035B3C206